MSPVEPVLEIRTYRVRAGERDAFEAIFGQVRPMLERHGISVVGAGPSLHDDEHFVLVRRFASLGEREAQLAGFYGGQEWLEQYNDRVMALIDSYHTVVVPADGDIGIAVMADATSP